MEFTTGYRYTFTPCVGSFTSPGIKALARDPSASLEDWQKLARTGKNCDFIMGEIGKRLAKL